MLKVVWKKKDDGGGSFAANSTFRENVILIERGFNIHSMYDAKIDINDRCHTFEALSSQAQKGLEKMSSDQISKRSASSVPLGQFNDKTSLGRLSVASNKKGSASSNVCVLDRDIPPVIEQDLKEAVFQIKDHLYHECGLDLLKSTFYFKYDKSNTLYLIYAAGIQAVEVSQMGTGRTQSESLSQVNRQGVHPLLRTVHTAMMSEEKNNLSTS